MIHIFRFVIQTIVKAPVLQCSVSAVNVHVGYSRLLFKRSEPTAYLVY